MAAAVLGVGTFSILGVAVMQTLYDRGVVGHKGFEEMEALGYLAAGLIGGAVVGLAVSVWVGLRVWQSRWTLLVVMVAVAAVTGITIVVATR
jgi:putative effector of murein hydrolase